MTVAEGEITEMNIGLEGMMSALYLKDLALKTRRGLKGRVPGGNSFGHRVNRQMTADGMTTTGERAIDPTEAEIVRRIFRDYVAGQSSRATAAALNAEGISGPRGRA